MIGNVPMILLLVRTDEQGRFYLVALLAASSCAISNSAHVS